MSLRYFLTSASAFCFNGDGATGAGLDHPNIRGQRPAIGATGSGTSSRVIVCETLMEPERLDIAFLTSFISVDESLFCFALIGNLLFHGFMDDFVYAIAKEDRSCENAHNHGQHNLQTVIEDDGMKIQGNKDISKKHVHYAPSSINACKDVPHDCRLIPKPETLSHKASNHEKNGANDKRLGIGNSGIFATLVIAFRANGLLILGGTFSAQAFTAIGTLCYGWSAGVVVTIHVSVIC